MNRKEKIMHYIQTVWQQPDEDVLWGGTQGTKSNVNTKQLSRNEVLLGQEKKFIKEIKSQCFSKDKSQLV